MFETRVHMSPILDASWTLSFSLRFAVTEWGDDVRPISEDEAMVIVNHQSTGDVCTLMMCLQDKGTVRPMLCVTMNLYVITMLDLNVVAPEYLKILFFFSRNYIHTQWDEPPFQQVHFHSLIMWPKHRKLNSLERSPCKDGCDLNCQHSICRAYIHNVVFCQHCFLRDVPHNMG